MNRKKMNKYRTTAAVWWMIVSFGLFTVNAEAANVSFGSQWYEKNVEEIFPVGMYLNAEGDIGEYHITLHYDTRYLRYLSGADRADAETGNLYFEGSSRENGSRYWLQFQAREQGTSNLTVTYAEFYSPETEITEEIAISEDETEIQTRTERQQYEITALANAPVTITVPVVEEPREQQEPPAEEQNDPGQPGNEPETDPELQEDPPADRTDVSGQQGNQPENEPENPEGQEVSGQQGELSGTEVEDIKPGQQDAEPGTDPAGGTGNQESGQADTRKTGNKDYEEAYSERKDSILYNPVFLLIAFIVIVVISVEFIFIALIKRKEKKEVWKKTEENLLKEEAQNEIIDLEKFDFYDSDGKTEVRDYYDIRSDADYMLWEESMIEQFGRPVISVEDVTMEFHLSSYNPSGLKDYLIQLLKRQIVYRKLFALYHVSFNVFKGEVLGIIGTNGSGKSTLLKIVSGALKPTEGKVIVDRKKVQLLTLGTGFDMELTARENVYLNGSIIGYSKEFLDRHYNDIVEFAELQDFMEEKVKNFSSGMVSRLGFAIATAGDAAEILILDEVLSVGDEFFRKKSLARVKELIHGGSTVLLVSHGMGTILENCTRCVWIEKGKLRMIGEPKAVCEAYQRFGGE